MSDIAIRVENLSKQYTIGKAQQRHDTLRDALVGAFRRNGSNGHSEMFWALKDVSFEVKRGEVVGIIGRNGAGKSTLLKILSQITEPTSGRAEIHGRVGSLLEVGTGFHPELTGRENIFLNGAILGMRREEIQRKFDEIVDFSGVEKFLDTPVKRYSSGMYVRLAFAVAAHLEPEILLVDEVLAVGDAAFQKKALGKMGDVVHEGRTVLFVSHNMIALRSLCPTAMLLGDGRLLNSGPSLDIISAYVDAGADLVRERSWTGSETQQGSELIKLRRIAMESSHSDLKAQFGRKDDFRIEIEYEQFCSENINVNLRFHVDGQVLAFTTASSSDPRWRLVAAGIGFHRATCHVPGELLNSGIHRIELLAVHSEQGVVLRIEDALVIEIMDLDPRTGSWFAKWPGAVRPNLAWSNDYSETCVANCGMGLK